MEKTEYIFGLRAVIEAIETGRDIDRVLLRKGVQGELARTLLSLVKEYEIPLQWVPQEKLNRITKRNHQGVIAILSPITYFPLDQIITQCYEQGETPLFIMLDGITDVRNFGAIARTAECAAATAIIIPERGSVSVNADAVKTSAGALLRLPVCRVKSLTETLQYLSDSGCQIIGASEKATQAYTSPDYTIPTVIVMGAEDTGISPACIKKCEVLASIPILGKIGSLNVSVAAGIMIYEAVKQRLKTE